MHVTIANPINTAPFMYLMNDNEVAKQLISLITGEEVLELSSAPKEYYLTDERSHSVFCLCLLAKIATPEGSKDVLIEMKKARKATDILRVRPYYPLPAYCIYFLGYVKDNFSVPVLKSIPQVKDAVTGEVMEVQNEFIECLHPRMWLIQIPLLATACKQKDINFESPFFNIREELVPEKYRFITHCLQQAAYSSPVRDEIVMMG
ncbi:MAG: hypothetical protein LBQ65_02515 [Tannerellaceae bacterium]|jgi:hypothetical protein|nr:hypothetical protein [Tannerellaceae bacterium]